LLLTLHASHAYQAISPGPQSRSGNGSSTGCGLKQRREIDPLRDAVARKIIELAETGERDPERLCDAALKACQPAIVADPNALPASRLTAGTAGHLNLSRSDERP